MILIASDKSGYTSKTNIQDALLQSGHPVVDCGPHDKEAKIEYPQGIGVLCRGMVHEDLGIFICEHGCSSAAAANKYKGVRAAYVFDIKTAKEAKEILNANVICISSSDENAMDKIHIWMTANFDSKEVGNIGLIENLPHLR